MVSRIWITPAHSTCHDSERLREAGRLIKRVMVEVRTTSHAIVAPFYPSRPLQKSMAVAPSVVRPTTDRSLGFQDDVDPDELTRLREENERLREENETLKLRLHRAEVLAQQVQGASLVKMIVSLVSVMGPLSAHSIACQIGMEDPDVIALLDQHKDRFRLDGREYSLRSANSGF